MGQEVRHFSLHNRRWPILGQVLSYPPAKFAHDGDQEGRASNSLVSNGAVVSGGLVHDSVPSRGALVYSRSRVSLARLGGGSATPVLGDPLASLWIVTARPRAVTIHDNGAGRTAPGAGGWGGGEEGGSRGRNGQKAGR